MLIFVFIFIYGALLIGLYYLIMRRLQFLDELHIKNTGITELKGYTLMKYKIGVILVILFVLSSFVLLTFYRNERLYEKNEIKLDDNMFG